MSRFIIEHKFEGKYPINWDSIPEDIRSRINVLTDRDILESAREYACQSGNYTYDGANRFIDLLNEYYKKQLNFLPSDSNFRYDRRLIKLDVLSAMKITKTDNVNAWKQTLQFAQRFNSALTNDILRMLTTFKGKLFTPGYNRWRDINRKVNDYKKSLTQKKSDILSTNDYLLGSKFRLDNCMHYNQEDVDKFKVYRSSRLYDPTFLKIEGLRRKSMNSKFNEWYMECMSNKLRPTFYVHNKLNNYLLTAIENYIENSRIKCTELNKKKLLEKSVYLINELFNNKHEVKGKLVSGISTKGVLEKLCPHGSSITIKDLMNFINYIGLIKEEYSKPVFSLNPNIKSKSDYKPKCRQYLLDENFFNKYYKGKLVKLDSEYLNMDKFMINLDNNQLTQLYTIYDRIYITDDMYKSCLSKYELGWKGNNDYYFSKLIVEIHDKVNLLNNLIHYDQYGSRCHSIITKLKKHGYRDQLYYRFSSDGERLRLGKFVNIDIHSSILVNLACIIRSKKLKNYISDITMRNGDIYYDIINRWNSAHNNAIDLESLSDEDRNNMRKKVKTQLMHYVNSKSFNPKDTEIIVEFFNSIDPSIIRKINKLRTINTGEKSRSIVPQLIQLVEAHLMYDILVPELNRLMMCSSNPCGFLTIHDCLMIPGFGRNFSVRLMRKLQELLLTYTGIYVKFDGVYNHYEVESNDESVEMNCVRSFINRVIESDSYSGGNNFHKMIKMIEQYAIQSSTTIKGKDIKKWVPITQSPIDLIENIFLPIEYKYAYKCFNTLVSYYNQSYRFMILHDTDRSKNVIWLMEGANIA